MHRSDASAPSSETAHAPRPGIRPSPLPPSLAEYVRMRRITGLTPITEEQAGPAIENSWAWATVRDHDGALLAMGRVIGDGGWYFHIADMATEPDHQGQGLGRAILADLVARITAAAPPHPYVTLVADPPGRRLYESAGFVDIAPSIGMSLRP